MLWQKAQVESGMCTEEPSDSVPIVQDKDMVSEATSASSLYAKRSSGMVAVWQLNEMSGRGFEEAKKWGLRIPQKKPYVPRYVEECSGQSKLYSHHGAQDSRDLSS